MTRVRPLFPYGNLSAEAICCIDRPTSVSFTDGPQVFVVLRKAPAQGRWM